jgi:hypothetical protein
VKQYAERAGLDPQEFSGHSLRVGFVTSAAASGASILKIQETSRHKSPDVLVTTDGYQCEDHSPQAEHNAPADICARPEQLAAKVVALSSTRR